MKVIAFITDYQAVDRIIDLLKLTFVAEKPPLARVFEQVALAAEERRSIFHDRRFRDGRDVYRLLGDFSVVRNDDLAGRRELRPFHVLDIETRREYTFYVKGGTDSELNGENSCSAKKQILIPLSLGVLARFNDGRRDSKGQYHDRPALDPEIEA